MSEERHCLLIVDDQPQNIRVLNEMLKSEYRILFATNGKDALILAQEQLPDLILLDVMMPEMDGYRVCAQLKTDPRTREIPVIFVTAMDLEQNEEIGLQLGAVDYITKPLKPAITRLRVRNHLELKQHRDFYKRLSTLDGLTGIANRRRFDEVLHQEWRRALRAQSPLSLILLDIDFFKAYNDNYGHLAGDECLKKVAHCLLDSLQRPADLAARYGGEEFACILPETDSNGALLIAHKLQANILALDIPHAYSEVAPQITVSQGVATAQPLSDQECGTENLLGMADTLLYQAKAEGRNRVVRKTAE
jgi:diguanylate cyclase (GGDEF)-like protein